MYKGDRAECNHHAEASIFGVDRWEQTKLNVLTSSASFENVKKEKSLRGNVLCLTMY